MDLSKEVIQYLSKEIETVTNNMMVFRTKIAFAVLVGPFLILVSFVVSARGYRIWLSPDWVAKVAIAIDAFC